MRRTGGKFLLSYLDYDDETLNEALLVRDRELKEGRMVIDPLTGKAEPHVQSGEQQAKEDGSGEPLAPNEIHVVHDWFEELKRLVPSNN